MVGTKTRNEKKPSLPKTKTGWCALAAATAAAAGEPLAPLARDAFRLRF